MSNSDSLCDEFVIAPVEHAASEHASPMVWLLVGYMWLFIHRPFEIWTWLADIHIERVYMIATILYWCVSGPFRPDRNRLHACFAAFVLVMITSWILSPYREFGEVVTENYLKYAVFYFLLVTSVRNEQYLRRIVVGYVAITGLVMVHNLREYFIGREFHAQGITRLMPIGISYDFNDLAGLIVCSLPFAWAIGKIWSGWKVRALVWSYFGVAAYCIVLTGSRMGFIGAVLASVLACWTSPNRWRLLALYPVLLAAAWMILPEDRRERYFTLLDPSSGGADSVVSAGNYRLGGFEKALPLFAERPLLGFGPNSFGYASGTGKMAHNLVGQLLAELGIVGAVAFGLILLGVAQNSRDARRIVQNMGSDESLTLWYTVQAASAAILLLAIMSWGFNFLFWHVWLWFGAFQVIALRLLNERETAYG